MGFSSPSKKDTTPQFLAHVYCGQTAVCIRIPLRTKIGLSLCDIVLGGYPAPPVLTGHSPQFSANVVCGQTAGWTKMPLGMEVGLGPGDFVFDGDPAPPEKWAQPQPAPNFFLPHVYCGQTAGWIKMPLATEVYLGPGDVALDGFAAPFSIKGTQPPVFGPCLLWPNGWMDEDATWYGSRPRPRSHYVRRGRSSPPERGIAAPPLFGPCLLCLGRPSQLLLSSCCA